MAETETNGTTKSAVPTIAPELQIIDGHVTTTSTQVADHFNKRHDTVLRAIRKLECSGEFRLRNFAESSYINEQGKEQPCYRITRQGFSFLAMGFTGKDAAQWKEAYIDTFDRMEAALLVQSPTVESLAPYSVHQGQTLSEDQAQTLRAMLDDFVKTLPKEKQGGFMIKGWAKLKAHFSVGYREIPADKFTDAVSIIARHIVEYSTPALEAPAPKQDNMEFSYLSLKNKRLLLSYDHEGRERIQRVPNDAMLATWEEVAHILREHYLMPSMKQLANIVSAGVDAMAKRSGYGKPDPMPA